MTKVHGLGSLKLYNSSEKVNDLDITCIFVEKKDGELLCLADLCEDGTTTKFASRTNITIEGIIELFKKGKVRDSSNNLIDKSRPIYIIDKHAYASKDPTTPTKLRNIYEDSTNQVGKLSTADSYIKIDLGGTSPIRFVKKSEIVLLDKDGNIDDSLLDIIRNSSVTSTVADILKEAKGKKWYYQDKNTPIEEIFLAQEYTHVAEEKVENNTIVAKGVNTADITLPTGRTISKNDTSNYEHSDPAYVGVDVEITPDSKKESTTKGIVKAPTFKVTSYKPDKNGTYIKVRKKGSLDSIMINAEAFITSVKAGDRLTLDGGVETEPLTEDEAGIRYSPNLTLQPSKSTEMTANTYLRLTDGRYIKETTHIGPLAFKEATGNVYVSAYAVKISGVWKNVDASHVEIDGSKKFKLGGVEYDSADKTQCIPLERCNFDINARFIQTATKEVANACEDLDGLSLSEKYTKLEETRQSFVSLYKKGDYELKTYYDADRVPKAFGVTTSLTATDLVAYAVRIDGKWKIVDKNLATYDASASKLTVNGKVYSTATIGGDVKPLTEVGFSNVSKVDFIQTGFGQIANVCEDLEGKTDADKKTKIEEIQNKYTGLFNISKERYEYTNEVVVDDVSTVTNTLEKTYKKESKFIYSNDGTLKMESGDGFKAKTSKAVGKIEGWSIGTAFVALNFLSILSPVAGIVVAAAAVLTAVVGPVVAAAIIKARNKPVTEDMMAEQQKHASKCINQKLEFTYEYLNDLVTSNAHCTDDMILSKVDAIVANMGILSASTYDDSCVRDANGQIKITPQNAHRVSQLNGRIREALTAEYKKRSRWERFKARIKPKNWFKKSANLELQLIDEEIRKEAYRLIKKYNSVSTKDEKIKGYKKLSTKELENLVKTKVSTKVNISTFEDLTSNDVTKSKRAKIDGITNAIFAEFEYPSTREEHPDKEMLEAKATNIKLYLVIKNALTDKSVIAFDYESGLILVGNQKLVKVGENDFTLENLTKEEEKKLVSAKKFYKSASTVAVDVAETIKNEAKRANTIINEEKVNKPDERSIEVEIINYEEVKNNKAKLQQFSADIEYLAGSSCSNIVGDPKFTGDVEDAIKQNKIKDDYIKIAEALNKAKNLYDSQKEQVKKDGKEALFLGDTGAGIVSVDDILSAFNTVKTTTLANAHNKYKTEIAPATGGAGAGKKNKTNAKKFAEEGQYLNIITNNKTELLKELWKTGHYGRGKAVNTKKKLEAMVDKIEQILIYTQKKGVCINPKSLANAPVSILQGEGAVLKQIIDDIADINKNTKGFSAVTP